MTRTEQFVAVKLHCTDDGIVWFKTNLEHGRSDICDVSIDSILSHPEIASVSTLYVLGFKSNADLICKLYEAREANATVPHNILIGTPTCVPSDVASDIPAILNMMDDLHLPHSCGGWHMLTHYDYAVYDLIRKVKQGNPEQIVAALKKHPAYKAVSFVKTHDPISSAKVLAEIVDPRWFVDPINPNRTSRLRKYMGMRLDKVENTFDYSNKHPAAVRARLLCASWSSGTGGTSPCFLDNILNDSSVGSKDKRLIKASLKYLTFIRLVWLDTIAQQGRTLFVPEYFFTEQQDLFNYKSHSK